MTDQRWRQKLRENAKLGIRSTLARADLSVTRDPYSHRLIRSLRMVNIDTILDIGANFGQFGSQVRSAGFTGRIISVEPLSSAFPVLQDRAKSDSSWTVVNAAVGAEESTAEINISANSYSSSLLEMTSTHLDAAPGSQTVGQETVDVTTVRSLVDTHSVVPERALLKVDTQGFESAVLKGAGSVIDQVTAVQLELSFVELYAGQELFANLVPALAERGLTLWSLEPGISDDDGRLLQCDGLFLRVKPRT